MTVLNILMQNPTATFEQVVGSAVTLKTVAELDDEPPALGTDKSSPSSVLSVADIEF